MILGFLSFSFLDAQSGIYLRLGCFNPSASTFNDDLREVVNQNLQNTGLMLQADGLSAKSVLMDKIKGALSYGGEIEIFMRPRVSLSLGVEYWGETRPGSVQGEGNLWGDSVNFTMKFEGRFSLLPIVATFRFHFPLDNFRFYAGGGAGYYLSRFILSEIEEIKMGGAVASADKYEAKSSGHAFLPHLNGGVNFSISQSVAICLDIRYLLGKIGSYEIKKSAESTDIGRKLTYLDKQGKEKNFSLELSGFNIGLFVKFIF